MNNNIKQNEYINDKIKVLKIVLNQVPSKTVFNEIPKQMNPERMDIIIKYSNSNFEIFSIIKTKADIPNKKM